MKTKIELSKSRLGGRENLSYEELYDDDSQNITYWTFIGFILVWVFTIIVRIY